MPLDQFRAIFNVDKEGEISKLAAGKKNFGCGIINKAGFNFYVVIV